MLGAPSESASGRFLLSNQTGHQLCRFTTAKQRGHSLAISSFDRRVTVEENALNAADPETHVLSQKWSSNLWIWQNVISARRRLGGERENDGRVGGNNDEGKNTGEVVMMEGRGAGERGGGLFGGCREKPNKVTAQRHPTPIFLSLSLSLSVCLSVCLPVCLSVSRSTSVC